MHKSVLLSEVLKYLQCENSRIVLDATIGGAGHAKEILKRLPEGARLIGLDKDKDAIKRAEDSLREFKNSFILKKEDFRNFDKILHGLAIDSVDAMLFDLGISSFQLEDGNRGFSFLRQGPLDMRMDTDSSRPLWQVLNSIREDELGRIIRDLGEERRWRQIAKKIISERRRSPVKDTLRLAEIIRSAAGYKSTGRIDPATRTFQALRIFINNELSSLKEALEKVPVYLKPGARIVIISFHSLEDRIVKHKFKELAQKGIVSILTKKPVVPGEEEIRENPRSRSAKLRAAQRL